MITHPQPPTARRCVEIMDTTLRDGEQTQGVAMFPEEKLSIARLLLERVHVNRIEIASAGVSAGERRAVEMITDWAAREQRLEQVELLGFCDIQRSADWVGAAGGRVINLLVKGSYKHLTEQLRKTPEQHLHDIAATVAYCREHGITCNCYPEDWTGGLLEEHEYAQWLLQQLVQLPLRRIMLPDTLGRFGPMQVDRYIRALIVAYPGTHFDFHPHNDYGLATANALAAAQAGVHGLHATVNGLGERAGNAPLDEVVVALHDLSDACTTVEEQELMNAAQRVEVTSGRRIPPNKPITGPVVFTQTAGIHADGDKKGNLYVGRLRPERFHRTMTYALGKHSGKASLEMNLEKLGIELTPEQKRLVLQRVIELGDQKTMIGPDDLPFILADVMKTPEDRRFIIEDYMVSTTAGLLPAASVKLLYNGQEYQGHATGDGGYDAFMHALHDMLLALGVTIPGLVDYVVHIPPGGRTDALVETTITWEGGHVTRGVDSDQLRAAILATEKMLNTCLGEEMVCS